MMAALKHVGVLHCQYGVTRNLVLVAISHHCHHLARYPEFNLPKKLIKIAELLLLELISLLSCHSPIYN